MWAVSLYILKSNPKDMANTNNTTKKGSYICKVGDLDIYQKTTYEAAGKGKNEAKNLKIKSRELAIYHAKSLVANGFKSKDAAVAKALELMNEGIDTIRGLRKSTKKK